MKNNDSENKVNKSIETALSNLKAMLDVNMVIGSTVKLDNGYIIPVSKITMGVLCGGGEYGKVSIFGKNSDLPYSAGNGALISVKPCGFLVNDKISGFKLLSLSEEPFEKIIEKTSDLISKTVGEQS